MSREEEKQLPVQITTRVDADVAEMLAEIAQREKRSMSAQMALILEQYIMEQNCKKAA